MGAVAQGWRPVAADPGQIAAEIAVVSAAILAGQDFDLVDLMHPARHQYPASGDAAAADRLPRAEAVFSRRAVDATTLAAPALVAAVVYRKPSLAGHLLGLEPRRQSRQRRTGLCP